MSRKTQIYEERVLEFISSNPRNRLIVVNNEFKKLQFNSLDKELSHLFSEVNRGAHFSMKAKDLLTNYFNKIQSNDILYRKHLSIKDIGILLERELQFDFRAFLDQYSQNRTLFLKWEGDFFEGKLYFLTKQNGIEIDISDLNHIVI